MSDFNSPFRALQSLKDRLPAAPEPAQLDAAPAEPVAPKGPHGKTYPRAVVRMERAGRGGKEATLIEQLDLSQAEREKWLKALKAALGCGGSISGDTIMLQGDHRERLKTVLTSRGVKRVIIG